jgi:hypothetical protein
VTRDEFRDEIWGALMDRMDIDVSTTNLADAVLERIESLQVLRADAIEPSPPTTTTTTDEGTSNGNAART